MFEPMPTAPLRGFQGPEPGSNRHVVTVVHAAPWYTQLMSHLIQDTIGLTIARRVAEGLPQHPERLLAKDNLNRWSQANKDIPSLLACYREWQAILEHSPEQIAAALIDPSDRGHASARTPLSRWRFLPKKCGKLNGRCVKRPQLEHILRAAAAITGTDRFVIIGSQSILGQYSLIHPPNSSSPSRQISSPCGHRSMPT